MRYHLDPTTLFIRGSFRAVSTNLSGISSVPCIMIHSVPEGASHSDPAKELGFVAAGAGIGRDFLGFLTSSPVTNLCVLRYDFVTVFVAPSFSREGHAGGISVIITSAEGIADYALREVIDVALETIADVRSDGRHSDMGSTGDGVIAAGEGEIRHTRAGPDSEPGRRVHAALLHGIPLARELSRQSAQRDRPAFFIFSRIRGDHWVEWSMEDCQYFPCHFPRQRCDFCYCPFYPCGDETLGQWTGSSGRGKVWNCAQCTLLHEPPVTDYLKKFPGASLAELVRVKNSQMAKQKQ